MNRTIIVITLIIIATLTNASGQNILQDYYKGDVQRMTADAAALINKPEPVFKSDPLSVAEDLKQDHKYKSRYFIARDGKKIFAYKLPKRSPNTIILLHGVKSTAYNYLKAARLLQDATQAEIFAIDLRGHGKSAGQSGDVDYINHYADDLADIIAIIRKEKPKGKIVIAGHSMGGGVALRYSMTVSKEFANGFLLFAPLIGHNTPAIQQSAENKDNSVEPFMKIHFNRIIGLKMMNELGKHEQDNLPVLFFNMPENKPLRKYTYRANMSMAPDDYQAGLKSVKVPVLVLIGDKDEAFNAGSTKTAVTQHSKGVTQILEGATHSGILLDPQAYRYINKWFLEL